MSMKNMCKIDSDIDLTLYKISKIMVMAKQNFIEFYNVRCCSYDYGANGWPPNTAQMQNKCLS